MRLNAFLARAGVVSRRRADEFIKSGRVVVNGKTGELNSNVSDKDEVRLDGKILKLQKYRYILLNKPPRTVTTMKDPQGRRKVVDLVDTQERLMPVGRLDYDTTGALLLTNDGQLAHKLMHPSHETTKTYSVKVKGRVSPEILNMLSNGVKLDDGKTAPGKAVQTGPDIIELTIHEGRNHQVKRMMAAIGLRVIKLHRSSYGPLNLDGLKPGDWRELTAAEVSALKAA